jgi:lysophospholipase L1-like esterase
MARTAGFLWLALCLGACAARAPAPEPEVPFERWEGEIRKFEAADREHPPPKGGILFVGSSSIRLWTSLSEDFPNRNALNRGFGGSELEDSTHYADRIVVPYQPRIIVLYAGDNDLARGKTPQRVLEDYQSFVRRVRQKLPDVKIVYLAIKPSPARIALLEQMRAANDLIRRYLASQRNLSYVDVFTPMLGRDGTPRPELFGPDGLHMNRQGYELWKDLLAPELQE